MNIMDNVILNEPRSQMIGSTTDFRELLWLEKYHGRLTPMATRSQDVTVRTVGGGISYDV